MPRRSVPPAAASAIGFAEIYERYSPRALRTARSICKSSALAEEAVQDAFEGIWKGRATYRADRGPVAPWVMSIVRHAAIANTRRRGFPVLRDAAAEPREAASPREQMIDELVANGEAQHLRDVLAQVPSAQREVIALAFYGQMTHSEIAEHLGLPAGTVKGRMRLGLEKLRVDLERPDS